MGSIYANSEVTFIAAAGDNNAYGLPGVGATSRRQQHRETVDGIVFLEGFPHSSEPIKSSEWASRAWTFQEFFFSPRRVIFTDNDVSYLCHGSHRSDTIKVPLGTHNDFSTGLFSDLALSGPRKCQDNWPAWLMEYSRRSLTYDEDALNAFHGILQYMSTETNIAHAWGVPIYEDPISLEAMIDINWQHEMPVRRREGFPSWSYISWAGPMSLTPARARTPLLFTASLGNKENPILHIAKSLFHSRDKEKDIEYRYLHLTGYVVELSLTHIKWYRNHRDKMTIVHLPFETESTFTQQPPDALYAQLKLTDEVQMLLRVRMDELNISSREVLLFPLYGKEMDFMYSLVLQPRGDVYERVGCIAYNFFGEGDPHDPGLIFINSDGQYLDEVDSELLHCRPLWLDEAERRTVVVG
ncbi:hypothetical protein F5Y06DRAFT_281154 [Hypoxylon sp. FL0890]|nr:hypothetical protein F5Y06DRAFT_281154 [Hypoxylon sp. FL0890]